MKSASLFLSLIACGQNPQDDLVKPAPLWATPDAAGQTTAQTPPASPINVNASTSTPQVEAPRPGGEVTDLPSDEPILVCATSPGSSMVFNPEDIDPEILYSVSRIAIFDTGDSHTVTIETGSAHNPDEVFGTATHTDVNFHLDEHSLDVNWSGASIIGWRSAEYGPIIIGGGWGQLAAPLTDTGEPPPPCGFEVYLSCWEPSNTQSPFQYDKKSGQCTNADGQQGLNYKSVEYIRETGDGECADLRWSSLSEYVPFDVELQDWDLRGANLEGARLGLVGAAEGQSPHHSLEGARLEGADLSSLEAINASIVGTIDAHTKLPEMDCITEGNTLVDCEI